MYKYTLFFSFVFSRIHRSKNPTFSKKKERKKEEEWVEFARKLFLSFLILRFSKQALENFSLGEENYSCKFSVGEVLEVYARLFLPLGNHHEAM